MRQVIASHSQTLRPESRGTAVLCLAMFQARNDLRPQPA